LVELTGLRTTVVDLATMALYNAFRHNYSDLGGCSLLVDIGARTTNLLFIESGKIFTRSIPIGGGSITGAIAKEFNEPFSAAEIRKKRDGSAILSDSDPPGSDGARVSKIVRSAMTRLHGELLRSISHYCTQQQGAAPERLFLSGGVAGTPCLGEFFHRKMQMPVEYFDPLRKVTIAESCGLEAVAESKYLLGEPVGLALRAAGECPISLNLRPPSVAQREELAKRRPFWVTAAVCFSLGLFGWGIYYQESAKVIHRRAQGLEKKLAPLKRIESQFNEVRKEAAALDQMAVPLVEAINHRSFWVELIEELNARLPKENIWITDLIATSKRTPLDPSSGRVSHGEVSPLTLGGSGRPGLGNESLIDGVLIRGLYLYNPRQQEVVVDYFKNLTESTWFALNPKDQANFIRPSTPTRTEWAFPYELYLDLRKPVTFP
jgi:type IV pilus assembly protein PilM